jgi:hypothetical protein
MCLGLTAGSLWLVAATARTPMARLFLWVGIAGFTIRALERLHFAARSRRHALDITVDGVRERSTRWTGKGS